MPRPVILCIDDEELGLEIRKLVLEREGFTVLTARDGLTGLSIFDTQPIDAVVLDYAMPGLDGGQVAAILRKRQADIPDSYALGLCGSPRRGDARGQRLRDQRGWCIHPRR